MKKLRVLAAVPTPPPYSGPEMNGAQLLASGLGPDVELTHVRTNAHASNALKGRVTFGSLRRLARMWADERRAIREAQPDVLYLFLSQNLTGFLRDAVLIATARARGLRVAVHLKGGNLAAFRQHAPAWLRPIIRRVLREVSVACLEADRLRDGLSDIVPASRICVVPNVVDFPPRARPEREAGVITVLFMGHLSLAKGAGELFDAIPIVLEACPGARFELAGAWLTDEQNIRIAMGEGPVRDLPREGTSLMREYGERVRLLGVVSGEARLEAFDRADLFVLPSHSEGLPMVVLEAMSCGIPVVVTPVGALPEVVTEGGEGRFVPVGDAATLASTLIAMINAPTARDAMGRAGAALVRDRFSPEQGAAALSRALRLAADTVPGR